ncbi:LOW QUALITY PROTEIN: mitochondrial fission regulator 1-like [Xyrauchen texanus]|uniref:LOW QUALITY PROTEIN: mitochondrial fission regulator 1-like n=1 Tax=Xyrauchen texanus TaxID=154827 RepID=UPI00224263D9|nr:LOW QUALITY PROTEIN: mitochondrial fission regulator 1-like [Xyrauchen texanus]
MHSSRQRPQLTANSLLSERKKPGQFTTQRKTEQRNPDPRRTCSVCCNHYKHNNSIQGCRQCLLSTLKAKMETEAEVIPIWQNKPHGSTRSVVRRIGSTLPLKPCPRACFQELPGLPPMRSMDGPLVPTLADISWIADDDEETYARVRSDTRPLRHEWRPTPLLVMHRNSSVPNFRREGRRVEGLRKPGVTAMNRTTALQDELSRLRAQIAKIVAADSDSNPITPDLLSPDDTSVGFSMAPFETAAYQPDPTASFAISDVTEEEEEEEEDDDDEVEDVLELVPDPIPPSFPVSMTASATFDLDRPTMDFREQEEDTVSLSKSTSFADVMDILKDMNRMKMSKDRYNRGCTSLREEDSASLISEVLKKKFILKDA